MRLGKSKTPTYAVKYPLRINGEQRAELDKRFLHGQHVYNVMVKEANKRINKYYLDPRVKEIRKRMRKKGYKLTQDEKETLWAIQKEIGLSDYAFQGYLTPQTKKFKDLGSGAIQKIGTKVWGAASSVLFGRGKTIHYKDYDKLMSLEGKTNNNGIRFRKDIKGQTVGKMIWHKLEIQVGVRKHDLFALEALESRIKFCRIVRSRYKNGFHYQLQLVFEGFPPQTRNWRTGELRHHPIDGNVGLDPGTSTIAAVSENGVILEEYGDGVGKVDREIARLNRKLDRQRRATNPQNYKEDGQIHPIKRGEKRLWNYSRRYYRTKNQIRALYRRRAALLRESQCRLANKILDQLGKNLFIEKMNFLSLMRRAKKTKINPKTGRPYSKKRFGSSILCHAPAQFIAILSMKAKNIGGFVTEIDPIITKGSQYNHITNEYTKIALSDRWKELQPGVWVQRDLYSAFLHSCYEKESKQINRSKCMANFPLFFNMQNELIYSLRNSKATGKTFPQCMGI